MKTLARTFYLVAVCAALQGANAAMGQAINQGLPLYRPADQLSGQMTLAGSATMAQLASGWVDSFRQFHPDVKINIEVPGSRSAVSSIIDGHANLGMLSRTISKEEVDQFEQKFGYPPKLLTPALERIALYVNSECPVEQLSVAQVQSIFARNGKARTWGDVGVTGPWAKRTISLQGRGPTTGSTVYFQNAILRGDSLNPSMVAHESNNTLVSAIESTPEAIGYAGLLFQNEKIRAVPISLRQGDPAIAIDSLEADQGQYPLMRPLQIVVNQGPDEELPPLEREFLKYIFSRLGQEDVVKGGFQPIPGGDARFALGQVGVRELN